MDVFNKVSLRAVDQEEAQFTNSYVENTEAGLIIVIIIIVIIWFKGEAYSEMEDKHTFVVSYKSDL